MEGFRAMLADMAQQQPGAVAALASQFDMQWRACVSHLCNRRAGKAIVNVVVGALITNGERWAEMTAECSSPCGKPGCTCHEQMADVLNALITIEPVAKLMYADFLKRKEEHEAQAPNRLAQVQDPVQPTEQPQEEGVPLLVVPEEMGTMLEKVCQQDPGNGYRAIGQLITLLARGIRALPEPDRGYSLAGVIGTLAGELGPQIPVLTQAMLNDTELDHTVRYEAISVLSAVHEHVEPLAQVLGQAEDRHRAEMDAKGFEPA